MKIKNEVKESDYIRAIRTETINFVGRPTCGQCRYFGKKSGLIFEGETPVRRYENYICRLTFEPLKRQTIGSSVGELCPLEFEKGEEK